jgi:hypothetical protein
MLGLREFEAALRRVEAGANQASKVAVAITAAKVEAEAKANFEGSHAKGDPHVGGNKPNVVTGQTRRSIRTDPIARYGLADYGTIVAPRVKWARRLELGWPSSDGTVGHGVTRAFPYFAEPAKRGRDEFRTVAAEQWSRFLIRG